MLMTGRVCPPTDFQASQPDEAVERGARAFGRLPNAAATTSIAEGGLDEAELVLLAYRLTVADDSSPWALNEAHLLSERRKGRIVKGRGFGKHVIRGAIAGLKAKGFIDRWQERQGADGKWPKVSERLTDKARGEDAGTRHIRREWFDGRHSLRGLAVVLLLRAYGRAYTREIEARFGWCRQTACKVLSGLLDQEAITKSHQRQDDGTFNGTTYTATKPLSPLATIVNERGSVERGRVASGNLRKQSLTNSLPGEILNEVSPSHTSGVPPRAARAADTVCVEELLSRASFTEAEKRARACRRLLGWDQDVALEASFNDFEQIQNAVDNPTLAACLSEAAGGRVSKELLGDLGLFSLRYLAAHLLFPGREIEPHDALTAILNAVQDRIGAVPGARLNSIGLIGKRVHCALSGGAQESSRQFYSSKKKWAADEEDAEQAASYLAASQLLQMLADADGAETLSPKLQKDSSGLLSFVADQATGHQQEAIDVIAVMVDVLHRHMIDGKRSHSIKSWKYFEGAVADEMGRRELEAQGLRPGDAYGVSATSRTRRNA